MGTLGLKMSKASMMPDIGARVEVGDLFGALVVKDALKSASVHGRYKAAAGLQLMGGYQYGGKNSGEFGVGFAYDVDKDMKLKAKFTQDKAVSAALKFDLAKGFGIIGGVKYGTTTGDCSCGVQLSIE